MGNPFLTGIGFGLTSGIITTLGLIVGLHAGTNSQTVVVSGIITIAFADAFSDALGIHVSEESKKDVSKRQVWEATIATFIAKIIFASSFILPFILFSLTTAIIASIIWGLLLLGLFSYYVGLSRKENPWRMVLEHISIAIVVIIITHIAGSRISQIF